MYYFGKRFDTFDMTMGKLLAGTRSVPIKYIDCISLRCFGFQMGETVREWFGPIQGMEDAVNSLAEALGIRIGCHLYEETSELRIPSGGMVMGPMKEGVSVPEVRNYYYNGRGHFLIVYQEGEGKCRVTDPYGIPDIIMEKETIQVLVGKSIPYIIYVKDVEYVKTSQNIKDFYRNGMNFHYNIRDKERENIERAVGRYQKNKGNHIGLQCAVMNLLMQLDKVFALAKDSDFTNERLSYEYRKYKQTLYQMAQQENVDYMPEIITEMWKLFEFMGC